MLNVKICRLCWPYNRTFQMQLKTGEMVIQHFARNNRMLVWQIQENLDNGSYAFCRLDFLREFWSGLNFVLLLCLWQKGRRTYTCGFWSQNVFHILILTERRSKEGNSAVLCTGPSLYIYYFKCCIVRTGQRRQLYYQSLHIFRSRWWLQKKGTST